MLITRENARDPGRLLDSGLPSQFGHDSQRKAFISTELQFERGFEYSSDRRLFTFYTKLVVITSEAKNLTEVYGTISASLLNGLKVDWANDKPLRATPIYRNDLGCHRDELFDLISEYNSQNNRASLLSTNTDKIQ